MNTMNKPLVMRGTNGDDFMYAAEGNVPVVMIGLRGADTQIGSQFSDHINGNDGNDFMIGLAGNDVMKGGRGDDYLGGGIGNNVLSGGPGSDYFAANFMVTDGVATSLGEHDVIKDFKWGTDHLQLGGSVLTEVFMNSFTLVQADVAGGPSKDTTISTLDGTFSVVLIGVHGHTQADFAEAMFGGV